MASIISLKTPWHVAIHCNTKTNLTVLTPELTVMKIEARRHKSLARSFILSVMNALKQIWPWAANSLFRCSLVCLDKLINKLLHHLTFSFPHRYEHWSAKHCLSSMNTRDPARAAHFVPQPCMETLSAGNRLTQTSAIGQLLHSVYCCVKAPTRRDIQDIRFPNYSSFRMNTVHSVSRTPINEVLKDAVRSDYFILFFLFCTVKQFSNELTVMSPVWFYSQASWSWYWCFCEKGSIGKPHSQ